MNHFAYVNGQMHAEGVALAEIAAAAGTPVYVYSSATLERHYRVFADAFAGHDPLIAFALKANSNLAVIETLVRQGAGADTVSEGEIRRALAAGCPAERIVFSGVGKTDAELAFALDVGVHEINVENEPELTRLSRIAAEKGKAQAIAIRVNPDVGAGGHAKIDTGYGDSKFGVSFDEAARLYALAQQHLPGVRPLGVACHIGSQITDLAPMEKAFVKMRGLVETLRAHGQTVERLDLGGGLGVPYHGQTGLPSPADYAAMVLKVTDGLGVRLAFEPGRLIAGNAGVLLSRVVLIHERPGGKRFAVVDAAMNDLIRPTLYDAYHDIKPVAQADGPPANQAYDVVGPICETGDTFTKDRALPPLREGDLVCFMTAGAYGAVMASEYNSRPLVAEVMVRGDQWSVVRRRRTYEDMFADEQKPDWL